MKRVLLFFIILSISLIYISCQSTKTLGEIVMPEDLKNNLMKLSNAKIFFGHQSVGENIVAGLKDIVSNFQEIDINVMDIDDIDVLSGGLEKMPESYIVHNRVGTNQKPETKCNAFFRILNYDLQTDMDIALLKFCYVDIYSDTDINAKFAYYQRTIEKLKKEMPATKFIHVTVPLMAMPSGLRATLMSALGKQSYVVLDNVKRNEFNKLLKQTYPDEPIFDLAKVESTYPDKSRHSFNLNGKEYYSLIPEYTYDGGHLNEAGRKLAAIELVKVLAEQIPVKEAQ